MVARVSERERLVLYQWPWYGFKGDTPCHQPTRSYIHKTSCNDLARTGRHKASLAYIPLGTWQNPMTNKLIHHGSKTWIVPPTAYWPHALPSYLPPTQYYIDIISCDSCHVIFYRCSGVSVHTKLASSFTWAGKWHWNNIHFKWLLNDWAKITC